jgi:mannose-1-phosphate guanylyltransferase
MTVGILLVGGFGTRLMPLTKNTPKPMLTVAGLPVTEHQLAMAKKAGITTVVLATSYLSEVFIPYFGDGSKWGMNLLYAVEKEPLGTGGAIRNAAKLLTGNESIVVFNGDVLSSHNLTQQIQEHEANNADVTLHLTTVDDARAYGCVPTDANGRVTAFLEKMDNPLTNTINAGCYVFKASVVKAIPEDTIISVERQIFPELVEKHGKIIGFIDDSYWLDIGTPKALLKGSIDLVCGGAQALALTPQNVASHSSQSLIMKGARVDSTAAIDGGTCIASGAEVGAGAHITGSIVEAGSRIGKDAVVTDSFVAAGAEIVDSAQISSAFVTNLQIIPIPQ